ncbi:MAG: hypothetical protein IT492_17265 [Gammaproteobacteria bacterium]|nr:hypothetical protein [Gammaproteobacteria bacterium]
MTTRLKRACARLGLHAMTLVMLVPFAVLAMLSVARSWRYPTLWPSAWQLDQWRVFGDQGAALASAALQSTTLALVVAVTATVIGFFTSQAVAGHRHEQRWMALALLPYALPPVVFAIGIGQAWAALHLSGSTAGVVLAQLPFATAYAVLLCRGYWTPHTLALAELAMSLGAHGAQLWWRLHWPLARGIVGLCLLQTALLSWFDFALVRLVGAGQVETLSFKVFEYFNGGDLRLASTAALLLLTPPLLALLWRPGLLSPALLKGPSP